MRYAKWMIAITLLAAEMTPAFGWQLSQCSSQELAERARYGELVRQAGAKSLKYVPKPFPVADRDVITDFESYILTRWGAGPRSFTKSAELVAGLRAGAYRFEVLRVEDWTPMRCLPSNGDTLFLVRIYLRSDGTEVARAVLLENGIFSHIAYLEADHAAPASTEVVAADTARRVGRAVQSPILVATWGRVRCDVFNPCVAMRSGLDSYVVTTEEIYEIPVAARRFSSHRDLPNPDRQAPINRELELRGERIMSLGGDVFVAARMWKQTTGVR